MRWGLKEVLRKRKCSTTELRKLLEDENLTLSRQQLWRLISGKFVFVRPDVLDALCRVLDCGYPDLLWYDRSDKPKRSRLGSRRVTQERLPMPHVNRALERLGDVRPPGVKIHGPI
jgi:DNA-binding Xre family transcriptional regulator